jgi:hypothetical protein
MSRPGRLRPSNGVTKRPPCVFMPESAGAAAYVGAVDQQSAHVAGFRERRAVPAARLPWPVGRGGRRDVREAGKARVMRQPHRPGSGGRTDSGAGGLAGVWGRMPRPRLTALGVGVLAVALMLLLGALDALLLNGHRASYGVCFVTVSAAMACWVRPTDLYAAPVAAPLAFTAGLLFVSPGSGGFGGLAMGLFTGLSLQAAWVYGGTLLAGVLVLARRVRYVSRRRALRAEGAGVAGGADGRGAHPLGRRPAGPAQPR